MPLHYALVGKKPVLRDPSGHRVLRIGHGGAGAYAPPNSLRSLELALEQGVDMVELDARGVADGLVLSHDDDVQTDSGPVRLSALPLEQARTLRVSGEPLVMLDEALELLKGRALVNVDLKDRGREKDLAAAILRHKITDQILVSSLYTDSLRRLREALPEVETGISYPEDRAGASEKPYMAPAVSVALWGMRRFLLAIMGRKLAQSQADNVMLYHKVITEGAVRGLHAAGVRVFAWTVDDVLRMRALMALHIDGITTNRPDLFDDLIAGA